MPFLFLAGGKTLLHMDFPSTHAYRAKIKVGRWLLLCILNSQQRAYYGLTHLHYRLGPEQDTLNSHWNQIIPKQLNHV